MDKRSRETCVIPLELEIGHDSSSSVSTVGMEGCPGQDEKIQRPPSELDTTRGRRRRMSTSDIERLNVNGRRQQLHSSWVANPPVETVTFEETQSVVATRFSPQQNLEVRWDSREVVTKEDYEENKMIESDNVSLSLDDIRAPLFKSSTRSHDSKISLMGKDKLRKIFAPKNSLELSSIQRTEEKYKNIKAQVQRDELQDLVMSAMQLQSARGVSV